MKATVCWFQDEWVRVWVAGNSFQVEIPDTPHPDIRSSVYIILFVPQRYEIIFGALPKHYIFQYCDFEQFNLTVLWLFFQYQTRKDNKNIWYLSIRLYFRGTGTQILSSSFSIESESRYNVSTVGFKKLVRM